MHRQQYSFGHMNGCFQKVSKVWDRKCLDPGGTWTFGKYPSDISTESEVIFLKLRIMNVHRQRIVEIIRRYSVVATTFFSCWKGLHYRKTTHYTDVIMSAMASQITSLTILYSTVYSGADQRKHQSSASLAFVRGIHRWPVNSPHKRLVTRKMFPFDDVIMKI